MNAENIFDTLKVYSSKEKSSKTVKVTELECQDAFDFFMGTDKYCTMELPEYFGFEQVLEYAKNSVANQSLSDCLADDVDPSVLDGVNLDIITNKDGRYGVRPLTLANPFLYYMLVRDICNKNAWRHIKECFELFKNEHFSACAIPVVKKDDKPEPFRSAASIFNWWNSMEQASIELSLKYRYMFITDITNCFGQINPASIGWALARKGTSSETKENCQLAKNIQTYLRSMQHGQNIGIPQGSTIFSFIAEMVLGYSDMLFAQKISDAQATGELPQDLEYQVLRYVDDYRIFCNDRDALDKISYILQGVLEHFNFRMNTSKTKVTTEIIADSIKADKLFYIYNTPIESKQTYKGTNGKERKEKGYDFDGFQKHLLFIYEFSRHFPNAGQLKNQLSSFAKRLEDQLSKKVQVEMSEWAVVNLGIGETAEDTEKIPEETVTKEYEGHLWENITAMVAISVQIAASNVGAAHYALRVASQMLADMPGKEVGKKEEIIELIYKKLRHLPNSAFLQLWLQNITHTTDDWEQEERYDMPLCKLVANRTVSLWNNSWLKPEIADSLPVESIVDRDILSKTGQVVTFKERRQYDEAPY